MSKKSTFDRFREDPEQENLMDAEYELLCLAEDLLAWIKKEKYSVRKLAEEAHVSPTTIQQLISGEKKDINLSTLFKVFNVTGFRTQFHTDQKKKKMK